MNATTIKKIRANTASSLNAYMNAHRDANTHPDKISSVFNPQPHPFFEPQIETSITTELDIEPVKGFEANHIIMSFELYFTGVTNSPANDGLVWDGLALIYGCDIKPNPVAWYHKDEQGTLTEIEVTEQEITNKYFVEDTLDLLLTRRDVFNDVISNKVYQNIFNFAASNL